MKLNHTISHAVFIILLLSISSFKVYSQSSTTQPMEDNAAFSLHYISLKQGVDSVEFERWVREKFNPAFSNQIPGLTFYIGKIERGTPGRVGTYAKVLIYSIKLRNAFWPKEGKPDREKAAPFYKIWETVKEDYRKYLTDSDFATYVEIK